MKASLISIFFLYSIEAFAQSLVTDFSIPSPACLQESIQIINQSLNADTNEWDFCSGDLETTPAASVFLNSYGGYGTKVNIIEQNGEYFGFFIGRAEGKLYRLDFGTDITSDPKVVDLGGFGINSPNWRAVEVVAEAGNHYGFIIDSNLNLMYRFSLGSSLTNSPSALEIIYTGESNSTPFDMTCINEGDSKFIFIANLGNEKLVRIRFNASFGESPTSTTNDYITVAGAGGLSGISFIREWDKWHFGATSRFTNSVYDISFGGDLSTLSPIITPITGLSIEAPAGISLVADNGNFYYFIQSAHPSPSNRIYRLDFGNSFSNMPSLTDMLNIGVTTVSGMWGFSMYKAKSDWLVLSTDLNGSNIYKISFSNNCFSTTEFSTDFQPNVVASNSGTYSVSLSAKDSFGRTAFQSRNITITSNQASDINFNTQNICANNDVAFQPISNSNNISSYSWYFGDTNTSTQQTPAHQYASSGLYLVKLEVESTNGCKNFTEKQIKIYDPPTSSFDLPTGFICTNNEFTFLNNTIDNFDGNLTYEWLVDDVPRSAERDFKYAFNTDGHQQIKLRTSIPGCSDELSQTSNVQTGPEVGFGFTGKCEDEEIKFVNESVGSISGFEWDFGNGSTSSQENPSQIFSGYGNYDVSLRTTGTNGCVSTLIKPIDIYSVPQTNFSLDLPPFACSGSLSQFNDLTPPMPDSNIASWAWSFGDQSNGTSSQKNPLYTYSLAGNYSVSLTTTSNFGCSNSVQKIVTIYSSPKADFLFGTACINQGTQFTDASTGDIKSWLWSIQSNTYSVKDPVHIFKSAANHSALLTVTGTNNCINQISKNMSVPVPIVADFTSVSTCATKPAVFDEINKGGADPAISWKWDFGDQSSATGSPVQHVYSSTGNPSVTMSTTRQSGCVYSITKTIPIVEPPKAQFNVFLNAGAAPFPVDFVNTSLRTTSYSWKFGDALNSTSTKFSPSFTYTELGNYTAELTVENALKCKDSYSQVISVVVPQINAAIADFKLEKIPGSDSWNSLVTIENKSNVALINPEVFLDISGNALISEKIVGVIKPNELLTHTFTAGIAPRDVDFACAEIRINSDDYSFDNRQCVNVAEQFISQSPYPNPANDELILEWISTSSEPMEVIIYNTSGQVISSRLYSPTLKGLNQVKVDVSQLTAGLYFASYSVDSKTQNFRFSIVR